MQAHTERDTVSLASVGRAWPTPEAKLPEYLTIHETAQLLRLGQRVVYEKLRNGQIPGAAKAGGKWRVDRQKVIDWMAAGGELQDEGTTPTNNQTGG